MSLVSVLFHSNRYHKGAAWCYKDEAECTPMLRLLFQIKTCVWDPNQSVQFMARQTARGIAESIAREPQIRKRLFQAGTGGPKRLPQRNGGMIKRVWSQATGACCVFPVLGSGEMPYGDEQPIPHFRSRFRPCAPDGFEPGHLDMYKGNRAQKGVWCRPQSDQISRAGNL